MIKKLLRFYMQHKYGLAVCAIMLVAVLFRFYEYDHRWALAGDQARDAVVAREALRNFTIPALGPFSSAGNYTTGNTWYIWVIASTSLFPFSILTPWVILSAAYVALVYLMVLTGKEFLGKSFAIILGLLTAVSPAQIAQSFNLTNPSLIAVLTTIVLYCMIKYVKTGKISFLFLFVFFISSSISVHFQAVYLLYLIPLVLLLKRPNIKGLMYLLVAGLLPFVGYILFDVTHNYYNYRGILDYLQYGQYRIYIPNRWLSYVGVFWPNLWGSIIGGSALLGYILIGLVIISSAYAVIAKKLSKPLFVILLWFFIVFVALRFYKGERFEGYFIFLHIFVLFITSWACYVVMRINKYVGIFVILIILTGSAFANLKQIKTSTNYTSIQATHWSELLITKYPNQKFAIYASKNFSSGKSIPLVLYLDQKNKNFENGYKIGIGSPIESEKKHHKLVRENKLGFELWDLNSSSSAELNKVGWERIAPVDIYHNVAEWYK